VCELELFEQPVQGMWHGLRELAAAFAQELRAHADFIGKILPDAEIELAQ
jgi:hypothetical protein